jgi:hypothetical protein
MDFMSEASLVPGKEGGLEVRVHAASPSTPSLPRLMAALERRGDTPVVALVVERPDPTDDAKRLISSAQAHGALVRVEWGSAVEVSELDIAGALAGLLRATPSLPPTFDITGLSLPALECLYVRRVARLELAGADLPRLRELAISVRLPRAGPPFDLRAALATPLPSLEKLHVDGAREGKTWLESAPTLFREPLALLDLQLPGLRALACDAPFDARVRDALMSWPGLDRLASITWGLVRYTGSEKRPATKPARLLRPSDRDRLVGKLFWLGSESSRTAVVEGARVEHQKFGRGIVLEIRGKGDGRKAVVELDTGEKKLVLADALTHLG